MEIEGEKNVKRSRRETNLREGTLGEDTVGKHLVSLVQALLLSTEKEKEQLTSTNKSYHRHHHQR